MVFTLALVVCGVAPMAAERVEDLPKPTDYVSDFAHVLSPGTIARLDHICSQLDHGKGGAQIAVVTVHDLGGEDKADFANRLEERWKVGPKGSDRGILMVVSVEDRHYWTEVGYGLEGILPDGKVGDIGREMVPYLRARDFDAGITLGVEQIAQVIAEDAKITLQDEPVPSPRQQMPVHRSSGGVLLIRLIVILAVLALFGMRGLFGLGLGMFLGGGFGGGRGGGGWGGGDGGDSGFGGFGGGSSGGGGAGGDF